MGTAGEGEDINLFLARLGEWCPQEITTKDFFTAAFTLFELVAQEEKTQIAGITVVADIAGFGLKHLKYEKEC